MVSYGGKTPQVGADKPVRLANLLCNGNYAVSGSLEGCEAVERLGKDPRFKARMTVRPPPPSSLLTDWPGRAARLENLH